MITSYKKLSSVFALGLLTLAAGILNPLVATAGEFQERWISGRVVSVSDGDTITLDTGNGKVKVRLLAIDSPEVTCHGQIRNCRESGQAFGREAKEALTKAVLKKELKVRLNGESTYDRMVGTLFYNGLDVNYLLVQEGFAWHSAKFANQQPGSDAEKYAEAQERARAAQKGLWSDPSPEAPWEWRKGRPRAY